jgi:hypothetical protein
VEAGYAWFCEEVAQDRDKGGGFLIHGRVKGASYEIQARALDARNRATGLAAQDQRITSSLHDQRGLPNRSQTLAKRIGPDRREVPSHDLSRDWLPCVEAAREGTNHTADDIWRYLLAEYGEWSCEPA